MKTLKLIGILIMLYPCFALTTGQLSTTNQENLFSNFQSNERIQPPDPGVYEIGTPLRLSAGTNDDRNQVSASRIYANGNSDRFGALYLDGTDIWFVNINFSRKDEQTLGDASLVVSSEFDSSNIRYLPNMDCLGEVTIKQPRGICIINYTYMNNPGDPQQIYVEIIDERGDPMDSPHRIAYSSGQEQFNSMVALTGDSSYVTTFVSRQNVGS